MTYKIKENITRDELLAALDALSPFYAFGSVLATAKHEKGAAWVDLYEGGSDVEDIVKQPNGPTADFDNILDEDCIVGVNAGWKGIPASYSAPIISAADFFAARDAFLNCIEKDERS